MIDLTTLLSTPMATPAATPVAVTGGGASAGRFGQTLEAFLDARDAAVDSAAARMPAEDRQDPADDGNGLPTAADDTAPDASVAAVAPPTWFPGLVVPPSPPALLANGSTTTAALTAADIAAVVTPDRAIATPSISTATSASPPGNAPTRGPDAGQGDAAFALPSDPSATPHSATPMQSAASEAGTITKLRGVLPAVSRLASPTVAQDAETVPATELSASATPPATTVPAGRPDTIAPARKGGRQATSGAASDSATADAARIENPAVPTPAPIDTGRLGAKSASPAAQTDASLAVPANAPVAGQSPVRAVPTTQVVASQDDTDTDVAATTAPQSTPQVSLPADATLILQANASTATTDAATDLSTDTGTTADGVAAPMPVDPTVIAMPSKLPADQSGAVSNAPVTSRTSAPTIAGLAQAARTTPPLSTAATTTAASAEQQIVVQSAAATAAASSAPATPADGDNTVDMLTRATVSATQSGVVQSPQATASRDVAPLPVQSNGAAQPIVVSSTPQPAGQVFAAAIATAWRDRSARRVDQSAIPGTTAAPALDIAAPIHLADLPQVQATGAGAGLDLTQDSGLQGMVDRIETLRDGVSDAADARDTRIRLVPDALGSVEIAVRQDGDRVHVHFTAEHDATRALIADAQPRLTELAAARGVRIGDTSVTADAPGAQSASGGSNAGGGSAGSGSNDAAPQPRAPQRRTPASARAQSTTESPTETRIA